MATFCLFLLLALSVGLSASPDAAAVTLKMDTFLSLVQDLESHFSELSALTLAKLLLSTVNSPFHSSLFSEGQAARARLLLTHRVVGSDIAGWQEHGVVLANDGSTVAMVPLLGAVVWGWGEWPEGEGAEFGGKMVGSYVKGTESEIVGVVSERECTEWSKLNDQQRSSLVSGFLDDGHPISLTTALGLAFLSPGALSDAPIRALDGCWDSLSTPSFFQLTEAPPRRSLTLAVLNGALDGSLLRERLRRGPETQPLSALLRGYYWGEPSGSSCRRQDFQALLGDGQLEGHIRRGLYYYRNSSAGCGLHQLTDDQLNVAASVAAREFQRSHLECPAVIPRCMWGAKQYNGTPTLLRPPLSQVFIHHTYEPSRPCTSFQDCAADMRSMQDFHQQDRRWDDIGYSFVVGSDGYLYEGRGWHWQGAHTKGYNSVGYGVSFIGDFTSSAPKRPILNLVKDQFLRCAVSSGYISPNYTVQGHRQLVNTSCPGDALYREIQSWEHFKES